MYFIYLSKHIILEEILPNINEKLQLNKEKTGMISNYVTS